MMSINDCKHSIDSAATNASHVQSKRESRKRRDATDADQGSRWRTFLISNPPLEKFLSVLTAFLLTLYSPRFD